MIPGAETALVEVFKRIWEKFGKDIESSSKDFLKEKWKKFRADKAIRKSAEKYTEKMKERYGKMQIFGMASPVSLENIFTHVNILSKPTAFRRIPKEQLEEIYWCRSNFGEVIEKGKDALAAVRENHRLFILGKPGAGKTTFLRYTTLQAIEGKLNYIPIFIPLKSFSDSGLSLHDYIAKEFDICDFPEALPFIRTVLSKGKAILLCDGLDEVNKEEGLYDRIVQEIIDFSDKYDESKLVITCRIAASEYFFEGFTYVEMADFDKPQMETFVKKWFADDEQTAESFLKEFDATQNQRLQDLARNPLLLTLLCISYDESFGFPSRRSEIYKEAIEALLKKWDSSRRIRRDGIYHKLSLGRKNQMFARIAAETFENKEYLIEKHCLEKSVVAYLKNLPPADTEEDIDGTAIIRAIEAQHGIFVERAQKLYSFAHLTFQEYYTAKYIVTNAQKGTLKGLIENHFLDESWREVFLLTAEMLDDADEFFEIFLKALDDFARKDERMLHLLDKMEEEVKKMSIQIKTLEKRNVIICLILSTALAIELSRESNIKITNALCNAGEINKAISLARTGNIKSINTFFLMIKKDCDIDRYIEIAKTVKSDIELDRAIALTAERAMEIFDTDIVKYNYDITLEIVKEKGFNRLYEALSNLSLPLTDSSRKEWKNFANSLLEIFATYRPIKDYEFTPEQAKHLERYLYATKLLVDCLEVAYVSDRNAIEERLLLPPKGV